MSPAVATGASVRHGRRAVPPRKQSAVVVALLITLTVQAGCTNYGLPLYLDHLTGERGLPLSGVSAGTTVFFICGAVAAAPMGRILMRVEPRTVMILGGIVGGVSLAFLGEIRELWQAYLCYAGMGVAFTAGGFLPASTAVLRLTPPKRRTRTLAISSVGLSAGGFVVTPVSSVLMDRLTFASATLVLGAAYLAITVAVIWLLMPVIGKPVRHPVAALEATGGESPELREVAPERDVSFARALRSSGFWLLVTAFVLFFAAQIGATTHVVRLATDRGLGAVAWLLPVVTFSALGGRLIASLALRRLSLSALIGCVFAVEAMANLAIAFASDVRWLMTGAVLLGIAIGHTPVMQPLALVEAFGVRDYAQIASIFQLLAAAGLGTGPIIVSLVHDGTSGPWGGYRAGYLVLVGCAVLALVVLGTAARSFAAVSRTAPTVSTQSR
jgi:MFS family permease